MEESKNISYGKYIISWIALTLLVVLQVVLAGINSGAYAGFFMMLLASIGAFVIVSVYLSDDSNKFISNIFKGLIVGELLTVILLVFLI